MVQAREFVDDEDEVKVHTTEDIEEGEISSDEEGEIKGGYLQNYWSQFLEIKLKWAGRKKLRVIWAAPDNQ